jgi:hypothetical protein
MVETDSIGNTITDPTTTMSTTFCELYEEPSRDTFKESYTKAMEQVSFPRSSSGKKWMAKDLHHKTFFVDIRFTNAYIGWFEVPKHLVEKR